MNQKHNYFIILILLSGLISCKIPALTSVPGTTPVPVTYSAPSADSSSSAGISWKAFFTDADLKALIDTALLHNQELAITLQEIEMARNDIRLRKSKLLPIVEAGGGIGIEKVGRYTSQGAGDASTDITPGKEVPEWLPDFRGGIYASWEFDAWKKLKNATQAAANRYLSTIEGRNFVLTNLIAEIASAYYELLASDTQLKIVQESIRLQENALETVRIQKQAAAANELAVKKFEAEVLGSKSKEFAIRQNIKALENELNLLTGRFPQPVKRSSAGIFKAIPPMVSEGIPAQLLINRPDIRQAELEIKAAQLDVQVARAEFLPRFSITAGLGFQAFSPKYLYRIPESVLFSLAGDIAGPLINKAAIIAEYKNANARQIQSVYQYEKCIVNAFAEVETGLSGIHNLDEVYHTKEKQVTALQTSIEIVADLFKAARADYLEVLMTQRDALDARLELTETRLNQFKAATQLYKALGGGWR